MKKVGNDAATITRDYVRNSSLLINLAKAIGRLVISYKEIQQLAGFTTLVFEMKEVLKDLENGQFVRTQIVKDDGDPYGHGHKVSQLDNINSISKGRVIETDEHIKFDKVPIVSPNGDILVESIDFEVRRGTNTVVTGPNGCGKSSLFRILSGLWPMTAGVLERPHMDKLFYIPQRPYLPPGNLRDQVIYPHSKLIMNTKKNVTDDVTTN